MAFLDQFFAFAPWVLFVIILVVAYYATRHERATHGVPIGKTYACANCGRRGKHEHMVPINREGAVVWYCHGCSAGR
ncbi:MAG: hypothetical protein ABI182_02520 [Candidatus Baltobacteraceae bacterium]